MRCRDAELQLALYLDERNPGLPPSALRAHLMDCPACHDEWDALQRVDALFAQAPQVGLSSGFAAAVLARIEAEPERVAAMRVRGRSSTRRLLAGGLVGVSVLLIGAIAVGLLVWWLVACGVGILMLAWLQDPQVVNAAQYLLQQAGFWVTVLRETAADVIGALLPLLAFGVVVFAVISALAYALALVWGWLISRIWWSGRAVTAVAGG